MGLLDWYYRAVRRARARRKNPLLRHPAFDPEFQRAFNSGSLPRLMRVIHQRNIEDRLLEPTEREAQARRASKPRRKRRQGLKVRALGRALRDDAALTAEALLDRLDADGAWTLEDDPVDEEIEMARDGSSVRVRDLKTGEDDTIPTAYLGQYLDRARRHT